MTSRARNGEAGADPGPCCPRAFAGTGRTLCLQSGQQKVGFFWLSLGPSQGFQIPFQGRLGPGDWDQGLQGLSFHFPAQVSRVLFWVLLAHLPHPKPSPRSCLIPNHLPAAASSQTFSQELPHPKPSPKSCFIISWNGLGWEGY